MFPDMLRADQVNTAGRQGKDFGVGAKFDFARICLQLLAIQIQIDDSPALSLNSHERLQVDPSGTQMQYDSSFFHERAHQFAKPICVPQLGARKAQIVEFDVQFPSAVKVTHGSEFSKNRQLVGISILTAQIGSLIHPRPFPVNHSVLSSHNLSAWEAFGPVRAHMQ